MKENYNGYIITAKEYMENHKYQTGKEGFIIVDPKREYEDTIKRIHTNKTI